MTIEKKTYVLPKRVQLPVDKWYPVVWPPVLEARGKQMTEYLKKNKIDVISLQGMFC